MWGREERDPCENGLCSHVCIYVATVSQTITHLIKKSKKAQLVGANICQVVLVVTLTAHLVDLNHLLHT